MGLIKLGDCKGDWCDRKNIPIMNRRYMLCYSCNQVRIHGSSVIPQGTYKLKTNYKPKQLTEKTIDLIKKDEEFYELLWNTLPHYCQECDAFLGDDFRDENGKVINKWRYSHILPKGRYGQFRHRLENGNLLCQVDHDKWEHGVQEDMKIYPANKIVIDMLLNEVIISNGRELER